MPGEKNAPLFVDEGNAFRKLPSGSSDGRVLGKAKRHISEKKLRIRDSVRGTG